MSTAATPSTSAWCIFGSSATRPSRRPSTTVSSHSGRERSSRRDISRADELGELGSPPGAGSAARRTCQPRSKPSSSTQTGFVKPAGRCSAGAGGSAGSGAAGPRRARGRRRSSGPARPRRRAAPPTAMLTGPCSAASDERSAGERASAIAGRAYPRPGVWRMRIARRARFATPPTRAGVGSACRAEPIDRPSRAAAARRSGRRAARGSRATWPSPRRAARLSSAAVRRLDAAVRGSVAVPGRSTYAAARRVYQLAGPLPRPLAVVTVRDSADAAGAHALGGARGRRARRALRRALLHPPVRRDRRRRGRPLALRSVQLDRGAGEVEVGGGAQLVDVARALAAQGGLVPSGSCPSVGIGGVTLGGGMGLAGRRLGLTCDRLVAATIITPDGRRRRVDAAPTRTCSGRCAAAAAASGSSPRCACACTARGRPRGRSCPCLGARRRRARALAALAPHAPRALTSILTLTAGAPPRVTVIAQHFGSEAELRRLLAPLTRIDGARLSSGVAGTLALARRWAGCLDGPLAACHTRGTRPGGSSNAPRSPHRRSTCTGR